MMKYKTLLYILLIVSILFSGCVDITDSYKPGNFGATEEEAEMVNAITEKYGDVTQDGEPRLLEVMMTSSINNFIPVDKVLKYSKDSDKLYVWFVYDNFNNDVLTIEWTYLNDDYLIHTFESKTGEDFGRGAFILEKPDSGWPIGKYEVKITGAGVSESVEFEIIDGPTESIPLEILSNNVTSTNSNSANEEEIIAPQSGFEVEETDYSFVGEWTSNWGDMKFERSGDQIIGEYTHDKGKLVGVVNGDVFIGTWSESPSYTGPNDAGDVELKLSPDGNSFTGNWRYGSEGATWSGGWTGKRK